MTNSFLNVTTKILAYGDTEISSNPRLKHADWLRNITGVAVSNPQSHSYTIEAGGSKQIFDATVPSTIDGTTAFDLSLSTTDASKYRITHVGGTAPGFRTSRGLTLNGVAVTFAVNNNATMTVSVPVGGANFSAVQVGDDIFVPHTTTGDSANVVSVLNAGFWRVLGKTSSLSIVLVRNGMDFEGVSQTVTLTSNNQIRAFSQSGLQVGDSIDITAGFSLSSRKTFTVTAVTDLFVEFVSTLPLASEIGVQPGASGMSFFNHSKVFLYVEADQECAVRVNGELANYNRLSPPDPSDSNSVGQYMRRGPTWSLTVVNLSSASLKVTVIDCE